MEGKLKHWNEKKGFGFITSKEEPQDVFIHISSLRKMSRRPIVGDVITFQIHIDNTGKKRATNASIKGVASIKLENAVKNNKKSHPNDLLVKIVITFFVAVAGYFLYSSLLKDKTAAPVYKETQQTVVTPVKQKKKNKNKKPYFSCQGKTRCSEMISCREAKFYLNNCEDTEIDGDHDGVPCESQWCN